MVFFTTCSVHRRRKLLEFDQPKRILLGVLIHQLENVASRCVGFVLMPDHIHLLTWLANPAELNRFLHGLKRMSSFRIRQWHERNASHYFDGFGQGDRFWKRKSYTFNIYSESRLREKLDYMHLNPVRAGLVKRAEDWKWSSARWYLHRQSVGVPVSWVES